MLPRAACSTAAGSGSSAARAAPAIANAASSKPNRPVSRRSLTVVFLKVSWGAGNGSTPGAGAVIFLTPLGLSADVRLRTMTDPPGVQPPGMVRGPQDHEMANEIDAGG